MSAVTVDLWIGGKNVPASSGKNFDDKGTIDDIEIMTEWKWITIQS